MTAEVERYLIVAAMLFVLGALGFFTRRNMIVLVLSAEMMLHGVSLTLVTFGRLHDNLQGQVFTILILTVATSEAGLALSLILALYQSSKSLDIEFWTELREPDLPRPLLAEDAEAGPYIHPEPMHFPRLTPAGVVPELHDVDDGDRVDDAASPTAESPTEPARPEDVIRTARR
jgi:NADH-quinone oxidoreductase subunit K